MRASAAARWTLAPVLMVMYAVLGWVFVSPGPSLASDFTVSVVAEAQFALRVIAPLSAGVCAFFGHRVGRYLDTRATVRSWARGMLSLTWPALAAAGTGYLVVIGFLVWRYSDVGGLADPRALAMIGTGQAVLLAWGVVGLLVGSVAHPLAAPLIAVVVHLLLTWSAGLGVAWPRLLTGIQYNCCTQNMQPRSDSLVFAAGLALVLVTVCAVSAVMRGPRRRRTAMVLGAIVGGTGLAGVAQSLPVGAEYVLAEPRPDETVCRDGEPRVCLWPESAADLPAVGGWLSSAWDIWEGQGIDLDRPVTVSDFAADPDLPALGYRRGSGQAQTTANAAYLELITRGGGGMCAVEVPGVQAVSVWLAQVAVGDIRDLQLAPIVADEVREVSALPPQQQDSWLAGVVARLDRCRA